MENEIKVGDCVETPDGLIWYVVSISSKTNLLLGDKWNTPRNECYAYPKTECKKVLT